MSQALVEVKDLIKKFNLSKGFLQDVSFKKGKLIKTQKFVHAVNNISFHIKKGEVFSLVGESGCGKSTTARLIVKLEEATSGKIFFEGKDLTNLGSEEMLPYRKKMQMVFQNPYASLNPRHTILKSLTEPMLFHNIAKNPREAREKAIELLEKVGLRPDHALRFPHQFSGGQRQRIAIARALALEPEFIIADEPVSALDVSVQAQILNLMMDLKEELGLSYLFIAHDLAVVKHISDRLGVMYLGKIVEMGDKKSIYQNPLHPYTKTLFSAVPMLGGNNIKNIEVLGDVPTPTRLPRGCFFASRCKQAKDICFKAIPPMEKHNKDHFVACFL